MSAQESFSSNSIYGYLSDIGDEGLIRANSVIVRKIRDAAPPFRAFSCSIYLLLHSSSRITEFKDLYINTKQTPFKYYKTSLERSPFSRDALY